jgi:photosystem II stability/assembly factor-like uncharacterized protein
LPGASLPPRTALCISSSLAAARARTYSLSGAGALYRSTDKAEHWQRIDLPAGVTGPTGLEIDPRNPQRLYLTAWGQEGDVADQNGGVYASDDGGKTWQTLFTKSQHVYDLTIDTRHPDTLYICGFDAAAYRSIDRGAHWERIQGYDFKWGHRVILDPNDPTQILHHHIRRWSLAWTGHDGPLLLALRHQRRPI